jgi:alanine dehydrogenase
MSEQTDRTEGRREEFADLGIEEVCHRQPTVLGGINIMRGHVTHPAVAEAYGLNLAKPELLVRHP